MQKGDSFFSADNTIFFYKTNLIYYFPVFSSIIYSALATTGQTQRLPCTNICNLLEFTRNSLKIYLIFDIRNCDIQPFKLNDVIELMEQVLWEHMKCCLS